MQDLSGLSQFFSTGCDQNLLLATFAVNAFPFKKGCQYLNQGLVCYEAREHLLCFGPAHHRELIGSHYRSSGSH